jgi:endoglucanase
MSKILNCITASGSLFALLAVVLLAFSSSDAVRGQAANSVPKPMLGVYDPKALFSGMPAVGVEHVFMPWQDVDSNSLRKADEYAAERGRQLLVTIEPWSWSENSRLSNQELLAQILAGELDSTTKAICETVSKLKSPITIRWGHEMDETTGRYSWSLWPPKSYIKAYRRFVTECRKFAPNALFMWSPMGQATAARYYPGDNYVDAIGISVFALQRYQQNESGRDRNFEQLLRERYDRVAHFQKPVHVAEAGCAGDAKYVEVCVRELIAAPGRNFPLLAGVVYFNAVDPYPWPGNYGHPDWTISPSLFVLTN